jgi:hypothetical protein
LPRRVRTRKGAVKRSGYEDDIAADLDKRGIPYEWEKRKIKYVLKEKTYTPDFELKNGVIIEAKGYMRPSDRTKHLVVKKQCPELDIRFLFMNAKLKLGKGSKTTYGEWATKHGFIWAEGTEVPEEWVKQQ